MRIKLMGGKQQADARAGRPHEEAQGLHVELGPPWDQVQNFCLYKSILNNKKRTTS